MEAGYLFHRKVRRHSMGLPGHQVSLGLTLISSNSLNKTMTSLWLTTKNLRTSEQERGLREPQTSALTREQVHHKLMRLKLQDPPWQEPLRDPTPNSVFEISYSFSQRGTLNSKNPTKAISVSDLKVPQALEFSKTKNELILSLPPLLPRQPHLNLPLPFWGLHLINGISTSKVRRLGVVIPAPSGSSSLQQSANSSCM